MMGEKITEGVNLRPTLGDNLDGVAGCGMAPTRGVPVATRWTTPTPPHTPTPDNAATDTYGGPVVPTPHPSGAFSSGRQIWWDATSLSAFKRCPRFYQLKIRDGWVTQHTAIALIFGITFHEAMEVAARSPAPRSDPATLRAVFRLIHRRVRENAEVFAAAPPERSPMALLRAAIWFLLEPDSTETLRLPDGALAVELKFGFPIDSDHMFCGYLDRVIEFQGDLYVQDYKTTKSSITSHFFDNYSPDNQMSMYSLAGQIVLSTPLMGAMVTAIQLGGTFSRSASGFIPRTPDQLNEWVEDTRYWIDRADQLAERGPESQWPMNDATCGLYGGCMFRNICTRDPAVRSNFLSGDFVKQYWDPTKAR